MNNLRISILLMAAMLMACNKNDSENYLDLPISQEVLAFIPTEDSILYTSQLGDSVYIHKDSFALSDQRIELGQNDLDLDYVTTESLKAGYSSRVSPQLSFTYRVHSEYIKDAENLPRRERFRMVSLNGPIDGTITEFVKTDQISCDEGYCSYHDSLMVDSVLFTNVYRSFVGSYPLITYISSEEGIAGFKLNSKIYKRDD